MVEKTLCLENKVSSLTSLTLVGDIRIKRISVVKIKFTHFAVTLPWNYIGVMKVRRVEMTRPLRLASIISILSSLLSWAPAFGQMTASLPQIAFGGGYTTFITIKDTVSLKQSITISLYNDRGEPLPASFNGSAPVGVFTTALDHDTTRVLTLTGAGAAQAGWASVSTDTGRINVSARYVLAGPGGGTVDTVAVLPSLSDRRWSVYFNRNVPSVNVGVALSNPGPNPIVVNFDLLGSDTSLPPPPGPNHTTITVPPLGHFAGFITDIFQGPNFNISGVGVLTIRGSGRTDFFPVMALLQDQGQLSSLPANQNTHHVTFVTPAGTVDTAQNAWFFQGLGDSFTGVEVQGGTVVGSLSGGPTTSGFALQRAATPGDGVSGGGGVVIYQVTAGATFTGTRTILNANGTVVSVTTLSATDRGDNP